jgi:hypothetical protein
MQGESGWITGADRLDNLHRLRHLVFVTCCPPNDTIQKQLSRQAKPIGDNQCQKVVCGHYSTGAQTRREGEHFCLASPQLVVL